MDSFHLQETCALGLKENCVHILWQIPQYVVLIIGEVMFYITAMDFSYSQVKTTSIIISEVHGLGTSIIRKHRCLKIFWTSLLKFLKIVIYFFGLEFNGIHYLILKIWNVHYIFYHEIVTIRKISIMLDNKMTRHT